MRTLQDLAQEHTALEQVDVEWLTLLIADWQIIADLSFADLVLWLPDAGGAGLWAGAQMRPTTGPTVFVRDVVGTLTGPDSGPLLHRALAEGRIERDGDPDWAGAVPVRVEAIPVRRGTRTIAVVARYTNLHGMRTPSRLEMTYLQAASDLSRMIARGDFPFPGQRSDHADTPRVGDGFLRIGAEGAVIYASPNAQSVYRRLGFSGDLTGRLLAETTRALVPARRREDEEALSAVLGGRLPRDTELDNGSATVVLRSLPLCPEGQPTGAIVLLRDVTELRRRDRELITKDATIREIHHRVKNNLQTVAALLRLQGRRLVAEEARDALDEAVRRVGAIAVVHEILSQNFAELVDFDAISDQLTLLLSDTAGRGAAVSVRREGSFGMIGSGSATSLALVLTELLQNAVEHGFGESDEGQIVISAHRLGAALRVTVADDGAGMPAGFAPDTSERLGLSIVRTLVGELGGSLRLDAAVEGPGTRALIDVPDVVSRSRP